MTALALAAVMAAVMGTPHCLGMCGGLAVAAGRGSTVGYTLGRVGVYALLGALAGAFGRWIPGPSWVSTTVSVVLVLAMAGSMAGWLPDPTVRLPGLGRMASMLRGRSGPIASVGLGVLNGLLPCGLLYGTLALPVASGSALSGAALMTLFGLVTALPLTFASRGFHRLFERMPRARPVFALLIALFALGGLAKRAPTPGAAPSDVPSCHQENP